MPDLTQPVILFQSPLVTGNHMHEDAMLGTDADFAVGTALASGAHILVQFWPAGGTTGGATTIASAGFAINANPITPIPAGMLSPIPGGGGGKVATITVSGNLRDRNRLTVTCTDNATPAQSKTATVYFYLKAATFAARKQTSKSAKAKKK